MKATGFTQAFRSITVVPLKGKDAQKVTSQLFFFPAVGLLIGLPCAAVIELLLMKSDVNGMLCGLMWTVWMAFITRGFHLDGLGDMADGFGGGWTRERSLEIMKDSRMGSFGVIAIVLCLLVKFTSASVICSENHRGAGLLLLWSPVVSRTMVVMMCSLSHYAKKEGLSYDLVEGAGASHFIVSVLVTAVSGVIMCIYDRSFVLLLAISAAAAVSAMIVLKSVCRKRIGGVTGDILGAACEITECTCLFTLAVLL